MICIDSFTNLLYCLKKMRHGGTPSARTSVLLYVIMGVLVSSARMQRALLEDEPSQHTHTCSAVTLAVVDDAGGWHVHYLGGPCSYIRPPKFGGSRGFFSRTAHHSRQIQSPNRPGPGWMIDHNLLQCRVRACVVPRLVCDGVCCAQRGFVSDRGPMSQFLRH